MSSLIQSYILICAFEPDNEINFKRFMLLFDKIQPEKRTFAWYRAANELQSFSHFLKHTIIITFLLCVRQQNLY